MMFAKLQFWIFILVCGLFFIITIKVLKHFRKVFRKVTTLGLLEVYLEPTSFHSYFSLSVKIIADESTFFRCMLGLLPTPTNTFEMSKSQNCKKTFFWRSPHYLKVLRPICGVATWHTDQLINWKFVSILHHLSDNSHLFIKYI